MVKVKLEGLNIVKSKGRFYVYVRETKEKLLSGFKGSRADLLRHMESREFIAKYNAKRPKEEIQKHGEGTLGAAIEWFTTECPEYMRLAPGTKGEYKKAFDYLKPEYDYPVADIDQAALYDLRDQSAVAKKTRFADKMISALSSLFSQLAKRKKIPFNPAIGMDKVHKTNKNANREWRKAEVDAAIAEAPQNIKTILMIARWVGFRGQTIATVGWRDYQDDPSYGKCFRVVTRKNGEFVWVPAPVELQDYLRKLEKTSLNIATRANGEPWESEKQMQTEISHFLRALELEGKIGAGTTLHGLRATYASDLRRDGADTGAVAAALGDRSERMGAHYTRHVENEAKVIQAFARKNKRDPEHS